MKFPFTLVVLLVVLSPTYSLSELTFKIHNNNMIHSIWKVLDRTMLVLHNYDVENPSTNDKSILAMDYIKRLIGNRSTHGFSKLHMKRQSSSNVRTTISPAIVLTRRYEIISSRESTNYVSIGMIWSMLSLGYMFINADYYPQHMGGGNGDVNCIERMYWISEYVISLILSKKSNRNVTIISIGNQASQIRYPLSSKTLCIILLQM